MNSIVKSIYKVNENLVKTLIISIPNIPDTLRNAMLAITLQLDFHTNPRLVGLDHQRDTNFILWLKSRDTVYELLVQSVYEFLQIFIANYMTNVVVNLSELVNSDVLHTVFRFISVCVYLVYLTEYQVYSEVLRYTIFMVIDHIINPIYKKLTNTEHSISAGYTYFTIVMLKIFYGMIIVEKLSLNKLIDSVYKIPEEFTSKQTIIEIRKATEMSNVLNLTYGGVNMMRGIIDTVFSKIKINTRKIKLTK